MTYKHGVYTSEVATSIIPINNAASCVPIIFGNLNISASGYIDPTVPEFEPVLVRSWADFKKKFPGVKESFVGYDEPLYAFARHWYKRCGGGAAIFLYATDGTAWEFFDEINTCYERFGVVPTVFMYPGFQKVRNNASDAFAKSAEIKTLCAQFGGQWGCVGIIDCPCESSTEATDITLPTKDKHLIYTQGFGTIGGLGGEIVDSSTILCGTMAQTDSNNGGWPYASPSNQPANIDGACRYNSYTGPTYVNMYFTQTEANAFNEKHIVTLRHSPKGWVCWGDETSDDSTDIKDQFISVCRTFLYLKNDFVEYAQSRVDLPLNHRQIEGILKSYNARINGLVSAGVLCGGYIEMREEDNNETDLLNGAVTFHISIAPPPPMREINGIFEYDVELFTSSLA